MPLKESFHVFSRERIELQHPSLRVTTGLALARVTGESEPGLAQGRSHLACEPTRRKPLPRKEKAVEPQQR